jgi:hypothetical protein
MTQERFNELKQERFMDSLSQIAEGINGQVWHSGGGIFGILVECDEERPDGKYLFGFADDVLGWDLNDSDGDFLGGGSTDLTIDQIPECIERCRTVIQNKEIQFS